MGAEVVAGAGVDEVTPVAVGVAAWKTRSYSLAPLAVETLSVHAVLPSSSTRSVSVHLRDI